MKRISGRSIRRSASYLGPFCGCSPGGMCCAGEGELTDAGGSRPVTPCRYRVAISERGRKCPPSLLMIVHRGDRAGVSGAASGLCISRPCSASDQVGGTPPNPPYDLGGIMFRPHSASPAVITAARHAGRSRRRRRPGCGVGDYAGDARSRPCMVGAVGPALPDWPGAGASRRRRSIAAVRSRVHPYS
jgi:hypothetical protein